MTDKQKLDAIKAEIHRLVDVRGYDREMANDLLAFMNSLPNEPVSEEQVKESPISKHDDKTCKENGDSLTQEPVNNGFEAEVKKLWEEINTGHSYSIVDSYNIFYGLCMDIADWQKQKDANLIFNAKEDGYRLGLATMKQQLMKEAISGHVGQTINGMLRVLSDEIFGDMGFTAGDKVKLIIIKQE